MSQQILERPAAKPEDLARRFPNLTAHDRCDSPSCTAQAFVRVVLASGKDLVFCGHCMGEQTVGKNAKGSRAEVFATRRQRLIAAGAYIDNDAYAHINLKPTGGTDGPEKTAKKGF